VPRPARYWIWRGRFTDPKLEQGAVTLFGCEPHAYNYGGTVLVERVATGARFIAYDQGWVPDDCLSHLLSDARTVLLCSSSWAREVTVSYVEVRDWTRKESDTVMDVVSDKSAA
jgi:hypothetical protein